MIQEVRSLFLEVIVLVILKKKKVHMNMCLNSEWLPRHSCSDLQIHKQCEWY